MSKPKKWDSMTPEEQEAWKDKKRAYGKAYRQTPEYKAYEKARQQTQERKAYEKSRQQTPERKAYEKARQQTPERKAYDSARKQTPERKAYKKAYRQTDQSEKTARRMMTALLAAQDLIISIEEKPTAQKKKKP